MNTSTRLIIFFGALILVVALGLGLTAQHPVKPMSPIAFSFLGVSKDSSSNSIVSICITNQSGSTMVCLACPPLTRVNGLWLNFQNAQGMRMTKIPAGGSVITTATNPAAQKEIKVPILWGFAYDSKATRLQQMLEDTLWGISKRQLPGRGMLYTNYLEATQQ